MAEREYFDLFDPFDPFPIQKNQSVLLPFPLEYKAKYQIEAFYKPNSGTANIVFAPSPEGSRPTFTISFDNDNTIFFKSGVQTKSVSMNKYCYQENPRTGYRKVHLTIQYGKDEEGDAAYFIDSFVHPRDQEYPRWKFLVRVKSPSIAVEPAPPEETHRIPYNNRPLPLWADPALHHDANNYASDSEFSKFVGYKCSHEGPLSSEIVVSIVSAVPM
ncbi:hypothetical protein ABW20_dc0100222 [Dactylellina cionopaga]|nr:hypothetical protein ABW20_dc0100222 [Dactylellina cionopaga]